MSTFVSGVHGIFMPSQQAIYGGRYYIFTTSQTGLLPPQDLKSGTVCHPISDYVGCHTASSGGYWRHFYSDSEATAPNRNILTYLLTCRTVQAVVLHQHRKGHLPCNKYSGSISLSRVHTSKLNPTQLHFPVNLSFPHTRCPLCMNCWQPL